MLDGPKSDKNEKLKGFCDIFDLSNTVKDPTCFTSRNKPSLLDEPSLLDVILVDHASFIGKTLNFNCVLSDVHNLIVFQLIIDVPSNNPKWRNYRRAGLKIKRNDWLIADTCPQAANHYALF